MRPRYRALPSVIDIPPYTSADGYKRTRGTTRIHQLGASAQIGISAQNDAGFTMTFDYVRVSRLKRKTEYALHCSRIIRGAQLALQDS